MSFEWNYKRLYWKVRKYLDVHVGIAKPKKYYKNKIISTNETNERMQQLVQAGKPFAAGRIGGSELKAMVTCQPEFKGDKEKAAMHNLLICLSGFFGPLEDLDRFSRLMEESLGTMDFMGVWYNQMEDYMLEHYAPKTVILGELSGLEPWYCPDNPWTKTLKGKKVLCIHPFKDSILAQYKKREHLFEGTDILPEFELRCVKAVQTLMDQKDERFPKWFDALEYMYEEAMKEDFDIALIGCGSYGLPLAAKIKKAGKQAVHMGGALQLLFGIRGSRWNDFDKLIPFYNEYWEYPMQSEQLTEGRNKSVENGCYW